METIGIAEPAVPEAREIVLAGSRRASSLILAKATTAKPGEQLRHDKGLAYTCRQKTKRLRQLTAKSCNRSIS